MAALTRFVLKGTQAIHIAAVRFFFELHLSCGKSGYNYRVAHARRRFVLILSGNKPFNRIATPDINYEAAEEARVDGREKNETGYTFFGDARAVFRGIVN